MPDDDRDLRYYPEVPPGCRYFNPRRLRRAAKKMRQYSELNERRRLAAGLEQARRKKARAGVRERLVDDIQELQEATRRERDQKVASKPGFLGAVVSRVKKLVVRRTQ